MDCSNFTKFIADSDNKEAEYHGWQRMIEEEAGIS
jgi:hypothetical protein